MSRTGWLVSALLTALLVALIAWFMRAVEWVDVDVPTLPRGEAARDRLYVAKQLARQLGASVTTVRSLEQLPPPGATLVIGTRRWSMFPGREAALRRWIEAGGHLVVIQSAWSADGETPGWVPMRSERPRRRSATPVAVDAAASEPDGEEDVVRHAIAGAGRHCEDFVEPDGIQGAFGPVRGYRVCGVATRVLRVGAATWLLAGSDGVVAARVRYGAGDITANALEGSFASGSLLRDDGALALAAMLQLRAGDRVWFVDEETRAQLATLLWQNGAPALLLGAAALALLLWRGGTRFGPLLADGTTSRRSIGEQVRRTAAFIAAGDGAALHRASVRALEEEARRSIPGYATLLGASERSESLARRVRADPAALAAAMTSPARTDRRRFAAAIARLERARRALLPSRRRSLRRPPPSLDTSAP